MPMHLIGKMIKFKVVNMKKSNNKHICERCVWGKPCTSDMYTYFCMFPKCQSKSRQLKAEIAAAVYNKAKRKGVVFDNKY